jgi:hypothetical protein
MLNAGEQDMPVVFQMQEVKIIVPTTEGPALLPVRCFPSPVGEKLWVESPESPLTNIAVFDTFGRLVADYSVPGQLLADIPAEYWQPGIYWIKMTASDGRVATKRVVK